MRLQPVELQPPQPQESFTPTLAPKPPESETAPAAPIPPALPQAEIAKPKAYQSPATLTILQEPPIAWEEVARLSLRDVYRLSFSRRPRTDFADPKVVQVKTTPR